ncbi:hypothetical protein EUTSA_v10012305mg [Eutrema salsugineum]|uniref:DUF4005 domain-containing protein n=1 Tax=Eutrema salsugineum TaxID=72664 RepID=V4MG18_EUTSA|nr:uncharacterized protein LOC18010554 [Eutrema salsugineum]ESQ30261.1 hypothetical protein EUTSA_v10012305mg [Eutrema salsugineum]
MGRAARWFNGLFSTKKSRERMSRVSGNDSDKGGEGTGYCNLPADPFRLRTFLTGKEKDQNKHAIAVATATATAAEAAVSAAKAAATVVRLTGEGRPGVINTREERLAAVKIQKVFRGSLARKALRGLKGIVKLQALVRGYLVRKRAAAMLQKIQALIRVQTTMRSRRVNRCLNKEYKMVQPRDSFDKFDEAMYDARRPKIVEMDDRYKRRSKFKEVHNVVAMSEYGNDFVYKGNDLELSFLEEKWKFATAHNTPRLSSSSHHHAGNNRYNVTKSVCGNALCEYGMSTPGYMEETQSFKANLRSHSAPRQRSERKRLSLDDVIAFRSSVSDERLLQQQLQLQRYSCSYDPR